MSSLRVPRPSRVLCERFFARKCISQICSEPAFNSWRSCWHFSVRPPSKSRASPPKPIVPVTTLVRDRNGNAVYGLHAQDFIIEDDGVEQPIHLEEAAEAQPISLVVAVQTGRRANREFGKLTGLSSTTKPPSSFSTAS